ncbi:[Fe-Fe] hydrogenase large subunit C-terminal domain-containing protein [Massiliimalia massiliensis]|uniref:[Fe-Fe] hydrogenase large subunit C-terminal domain-containing protein n=1 Tax=Massiliimalia massiliensis TaxID=1852384 RepID=UPI0009877542|nr:[Fe-Fe] hydrogenase large subunit C-terminal domain-containing protein [Massiliimalia massiliensis]MBS1473656.1 4Fe-4S dicluster domain-containing protein [Massiliimalia sp.]
MKQKEFFHSVTLDRDKCKGCINCIKRCPTEAIRVRNGKAKIISERCIDCGECIRVCPHHAKKAIYDPLSVIDNYEYTIALPAPSFYGQFNNLDDVDIVLSALLDLGFDSVYEVSKAAELISDATRRILHQTDCPRPLISSACPAVTRLIRVRFPSLIDNILDLNAPVELAARLAKKEAMEKTGLPAEKIGAIFISPCPAKVTAAKMPLGTAKSEISAVLAVSEVYPKLLKYMDHDRYREGLSDSGKMGVAWASSAGESSALLNDNYLAADGIENVIRVLEDLEDEKFTNLDFIELNACNGGCVGGVLNVENPYIARTKLKRLRKYLPVSLNHLKDMPPEMPWDEPLEFTPVMELDANFSVALNKMNEMERIEASLPGLDCGSCGAPSCKALAEDVVRGFASVDDCVFKFRENVASLMDNIHRLNVSIPQAYREAEASDAEKKKEE